MARLPTQRALLNALFSYNDRLLSQAGAVSEKFLQTENRVSNNIVSRNNAVVGNWDGEDAEGLKIELDHVKKKLRAEGGGDRVEPSGIPHREQFPDDLKNFTPYILWGCDKKLICLAGSGANRLESVETIRKYYANDIAKDAMKRHDAEVNVDDAGA